MKTELIFDQDSKPLGPKSLCKRSVVLHCWYNSKHVVVYLNDFIGSLFRSGGKSIERITAKTQNIISKTMPPLREEDIIGTERTGFKLDELVLRCWQDHANLKLAA